MPVLHPSAPRFCGCAAKDIHGPEASKPAEAVLRLNKLFEMEKELDGLPPEQKKKERLNREKPLLEAFWSWAEISSAGELPKSKLHTAFHSKYCPACAKKIQREKLNESKRRSREQKRMACIELSAKNDRLMWTCSDS